MPLIFTSFLSVVIACFLHVIRMMALEGRLLEIQKNHISQFNFLVKIKELTLLKSWKRLEGHRLPQGAGAGSAPEG